MPSLAIGGIATAGTANSIFKLSQSCSSGAEGYHSALQGYT